MKHLLLNNRYFLVPHLLFLIVGAILILGYEKGNEILYVNQIHTYFFNHFFIGISRSAEFPLLLLIVLAAFVSNYGNAILILLSFAINGAITQLLKVVVFADQVRPVIFFEGKNLKFIDGLEMLHNHSFPSGHTSGAFAVLFMIALLSKDKRFGLLLFMFALLVGISRVYLMQHFFRDIYFGSILGVSVSASIYLVAINSAFYSKLSWREKRIIK